MTPLSDIILLFPYYLTLKIRHFLYDKGIWKSKSYPVPVISIGNVTVGGTGKTPHSELFLRVLGDRYKVAVVSRGYGRKSSGYREVAVGDSAREAGDEPLQIKRKYPNVRVVVDGNRQRAIDQLLEGADRPDVILLDDAFQHRAVTPGLSVVLINYHRPIDQDHLLPLGRLRDLPETLKRADWVIVTKYPGIEVTELERKQWRERLHLRDDQRLFFSKIAYDKPLPVLPGGDARYCYAPKAILFSGIADDRLLTMRVRSDYQLVGHRRFADHHNFSASEWRTLAQLAAKQPTAVVLTTEKDARRIVPTDVPESLRERLFYVPIKAEIIPAVEHLPRVIPEELCGLGEKELYEALMTIL